MKRTDRLTKVVSLLLFGALLAYLSVYILRAASDNLRTAPAVLVSLTENALASGLVVRDEMLIESSDAYLRVVAENGKLVSAGGSVAVVYSGEDALQRAARIRELELREQYITSVLSGRQTAESLSDRDRDIRNALISVAASAARHDTDALSSAALRLSSLVVENTEINTTEVDLGLVRAELETLRRSALSDTSAITANAPGLFSATPDGYERLTPDMLSGLTPSKLAQLEAEPQALGDAVRGKLSSPFEWYFAATLAKDDAERLKAGQSVSLDFGRYSSSLLTASVVSVSAAEDGACAVVFRCTAACAEMLFVRRATAELVFEGHEGLRVPKQAVLSDENGAYVYVLTGLQAEKKSISIVWETDDYYLAAVSQEPSALRAGNDIILTTKGLYDGKLVKD